MRIAELSEATGVPIATIKYYVREGLVPPGTPTARNQARYDHRHVERLELIRALRDGADLPIATIAAVFASMDEHRPADRPEYLSQAVRALSEGPDAPHDEHRDVAERQVRELLADLAWDIDVESPGYHDLIDAVAAVHRFLPGLITSGSQLRVHATAMRAVAEVEIPATFDPDHDPHNALRLAVLGTVLFEPVLLAFRKLAHVDRRRTLAAQASARPEGRDTITPRRR